VKILVIGSGAREHALVNSLNHDTDTEVFCAPGNAGIAAEVPVFSLSATDKTAVLALAQELQADLVVIGPEAPLVAGLADTLRDAGLAVFGPSAAAAALEGSKAFAKDVMISAGVPTAGARVCRTQAEIESALREFGAPHVVKDDGLAAGKGVVVTDDFDAALKHGLACITGRTDGAVVIEEFLDGPEVSLFAVTDGVTVVPLSPAQDFKRAYDNDQGPNTGGMGAYSPLPWAPQTLVDDVMRDVLQPTVDEMARRGTPFVGLLYAGLALTSRGTKVIEFNARFGDPETQVVLARLASPLSALLYAAATGTLADLPELHWKDESAITVVLASKGYPQAPIMGAAISGLNEIHHDAVEVFHAGTNRNSSGEIVVSGGRVLCVTASGYSLEEARNNAYGVLGHIQFDGEHHRNDIALKAAHGEITVP
jgi:phosphoribosylamine--glycine ligase